MEIYLCVCARSSSNRFRPGLALGVYFLLYSLFDIVPMSRAIQRLLKDYRKAEKLVGRSTNEPFVDLTNANAFTTQTMTQIRRDPELTQDEKKFLVAVERK